jgi:hypothetical protein
MRVVCVDDNFTRGLYDISTPTAGAVYTVRGVVPAEYGQFGLWLAEISNEPNAYINYGKLVIDEPAFLTRRFLPVTDISVFKGMLNAAPIEAARRLRELEREDALFLVLEHADLIVLRLRVGEAIALAGSKPE